MKFSSYMCEAEQDRGVRMIVEIMLQFTLDLLLWSDISMINQQTAKIWLWRILEKYFHALIISLYV